MSEHNAISPCVVVPDQNKSRAQLLKWLEESVRPPSVSSNVILSHYQKAEQSVLKKILLRMDSHEKDGRISLWEFFDAVDADGDGVSSTFEAREFLLGRGFTPVYCAAFESEQCNREFMAWEAEFGLFRSLVVFLQHPEYFGDRGIQLQNLNMARRGSSLSRPSSAQPEVAHDTDSMEKMENEDPWGWDLPDANSEEFYLSADANFCAEEEPGCEGVSPCDPDTCEDEDPDYEDRFLRYAGGDDEADDDDWLSSEENLWSAEEDEMVEENVEMENQEMNASEIAEEEWLMWEEEVPDLKNQLANEMNELAEIEAARDAGEDYDEVRFQHLIEDSTRLTENIRELLRNSYVND